MICPILTINSVSDHDCKKEDCAWWNDDAEKCAILQLSRDLYRIEGTVSMF